MGIRVKAVRLGFYGGKRRRIGQVFEIAKESHFSDAYGKKWPGWMVRVTDAEEVEEEPVTPSAPVVSEKVVIGSKARAAEKAPEVKAPAGKAVKGEKAPTGSKDVIGE